ncbi:hypothetical protein D770_04835 [Flammeovirgaceae bacterium 311]|nr:hypothetical protein D770_04835 [Flammeovirgaceae bacterium 311]
MNNYIADIEARLTGSFVCGIGIISEMAIIDFAKEHEVYRLWIDTDWVLTGFESIEALSQEQNELLMLNELRNQTVKSFDIDAAKNINIIFSEAETVFYGNPQDQNVLEPWRIFQLAPENKTMLIHSR